MNDYPKNLAAVNQIEPVPRRIRGYIDHELVIDTTAALYVWEVVYYPAFYIPKADITAEFLIDEAHSEKLRRGPAQRFGLKVGDFSRPASAHVYGDDALEGLSGFARIDWTAIDSWFEEDEEIFVHPRSPYTRTDALRSSRKVRIELDGVVLAQSDCSVMLFETGLPTRYYLDRTALNFDHLVESDTVTECPYKGTTTGYWSVKLGDALHQDLAWSYDFPRRDVLPIAGMVAFYNEKVDIFIDGEKLERAKTKFS
jgi:uncharacterized protein (DUF427 family)